MGKKTERNVERLKGYTSCIYNLIGIPINRADTALKIHDLYQIQQRTNPDARVTSDIYLDVFNYDNSEGMEFPDGLGVGVMSQGFITFPDRRIPFERPNLSHINADDVVEASIRNHEKMRRLVKHLGVSLPERTNVWDSTNLYGTRLPA